MYHYISTPPEGSDNLRRDLSVTPNGFAEHLQALRRAGYTSIRLYDLYEALLTGHPLPAKPIILTFDDGHRDAYTEALPLLQRYGFSGTFFLVTKLIDDQSPTTLTWEQVTAMSAAGMDMEAHGYTHDDLRQRSTAFLVWQMLGAKEAIEARTQKPVRYFCYPSGQYDAETTKVLRSAQYWGAVTVHSGTTQRSDRPFELERIRVRGRYSGQDVVDILAAYERDGK
jgi:peptidoglycan/xylan/chitin deacetylase (PgdA/CDA1 family)